jgi:glycosyltransferase involved in cell wall biosynthesis
VSGADDRPGFAQPRLGRSDGVGIPVVASRTGGLPCTVTDGVTGLLIEPGDPADLARKISRSLDDPESRHRMGKELVSVHFSRQEKMN